MGRRRNMKFKDDKADLYPLKGHIRCPIHGRTLSVYGSRSRNGKIHHYYVCTKNRCPRYPIDYAHSEIERLLGEVQFSARVIKSYRSILERIFEAEDSSRAKLIFIIFLTNLLENYFNLFLSHFCLVFIGKNR